MTVREFVSYTLNPVYGRHRAVRVVSVLRARCTLTVVIVFDGVKKAV